jgi:hypothetical protein
MQERAAIVRASIDIVSTPGQGTSVTVKVAAPEVSIRKAGGAIEPSKDGEEGSKQKSDSEDRNKEYM